MKWCAQVEWANRLKRDVTEALKSSGSIGVDPLIEFSHGVGEDIMGWRSLFCVTFVPFQQVPRLWLLFTGSNGAVEARCGLQEVSKKGKS